MTRQIVNVSSVDSGSIDDTLTIATDGGVASTLVCDVTDSRQVDAAIGGLERIDILVNAAGFNIPEPLENVTEQHFDQIILKIRGPEMRIFDLYLVEHIDSKIHVHGLVAKDVLELLSGPGHLVAPPHGQDLGKSDVEEYALEYDIEGK